MIGLHHKPTQNGHKIVRLLEESGIADRIRPVDLSNNEQFKPEFLALAPNVDRRGRVPLKALPTAARHRAASPKQRAPRSAGKTALFASARRTKSGAVLQDGERAMFRVVRQYAGSRSVAANCETLLGCRSDEALDPLFSAGTSCRPANAWLAHQHVGRSRCHADRA